MTINTFNNGSKRKFLRENLNKVIEGYTSGTLETLAVADYTLNPFGDFVGAQGELDRTYHVELGLGATIPMPDASNITLAETFTLRHPGEHASMKFIPIAGGNGAGLYIIVDTDLMIYASKYEPVEGFIITPTIKKHYKVVT
jgi:hypothetical protein